MTDTAAVAGNMMGMVAAAGIDGGTGMMTRRSIVGSTTGGTRFGEGVRQWVGWMDDDEAGHMVGRNLFLLGGLWRGEKGRRGK